MKKKIKENVVVIIGGIITGLIIAELVRNFVF